MEIGVKSLLYCQKDYEKSFDRTTMSVSKIKLKTKSLNYLIGLLDNTFFLILFHFRTTFCFLNLAGLILLKKSAQYVS